MDIDPVSETTEKTTIFQWKFVLLPVSTFAASLVLIAIFYAMLSQQVAYTFDMDGSISREMGRTNLVIWMAGIQLGLTGFSLLTVNRTIALFNRFVYHDAKSIQPDMILSLMGNMVGLPQLIIFFAMLDIFSYNSFGIHLLPLWLNALIFLLAGGLVLGIFFLRALAYIRRSNKE